MSKSKLRVMQLHVEARDDSGWRHIDKRRLLGARGLTELLGVVGGLKRKSFALVLDGVPTDASEATRVSIAEMKLVGISVMDAQALAKVAWEKGPTRKGLVQPHEYAEILAGEAVTGWCKGALGATIVDNDEMARQLRAGTAGFRMLTLATWTHKLKHRASVLYELYTQHIQGHDDRRVVAAWGRF